MSWSVGYDFQWQRDIGYGVPATCDNPGCGASIDRGLGYVCGGEPYGGDRGCGLYFCTDHLYFSAADEDPQMCQRCCDQEPAFSPTPDAAEWTHHKATDPSWAQWRMEQAR
jgi:hypothetical protein